MVVFLGANDFSVPPQPSYDAFSDGYNALLDHIEAVYGSSVSIIATCGPFSDFCYDDFQQRVVAARKDSRVSFFTLNGSIPNESNPGPFIGCDGHPDAQGAALMAKQLAPELL